MVRELRQRDTVSYADNDNDAIESSGDERYPKRSKAAVKPRKQAIVIASSSEASDDDNEEEQEDEEMVAVEESENEDEDSEVSEASGSEDEEEDPIGSQSEEESDGDDADTKGGKKPTRAAVKSKGKENTRRSKGTVLSSQSEEEGDDDEEEEGDDNDDDEDNVGGKKPTRATVKSKGKEDTRRSKGTVLSSQSEEEGDDDDEDDAVAEVGKKRTRAVAQPKGMDNTKHNKANKGGAKDKIGAKPAEMWRQFGFKNVGGIGAKPVAKPAGGSKPEAKPKAKSQAKPSSKASAVASKQSTGSRKSTRAAAVVATMKSYEQQNQSEDDFVDDDSPVRPKKKVQAKGGSDGGSDDVSEDGSEVTSPLPRKSRGISRKTSAPSPTNKRRSARDRGAPVVPKAADASESESGSGSGSELEETEESEEEEEEDVEQEAGGPKGKVDKILSHDTKEDKFLVKFVGKSYREAELLSPRHIEAQRPQLFRNFVQRQINTEVEADWTTVDRIMDHKGLGVGKRSFLTKWKDLEYSESTWESEESLKEQGDEEHIEVYLARCKAAGRRKARSLTELRKHDTFEMPTFGNGRKLRAYQEVSVRWMVNNFCQRNNCILGDEMGLGKTAQSISCLESLRKLGNVNGPFLLVAPLTTLGHWQREIQTWTDMNVVVYSGSSADRKMIEDNEFYFDKPRGRIQQSDIKFDALLVSYEMLLKERGLFGRIPFAVGVFDEAHKLKGINSSTRSAVMDLNVEWKLLLTGTPIQNNLSELFSILNLLDPDAHPDIEEFNEMYGDGSASSVDQVKALQAILAPILLRRMKEDVETLPEKEEVIVWVELTAEQRSYYKALYSKQIGALMKGTESKNLPNMKNLAMELRKLCCHPYLCNGLEEDIAYRRSMATAAAGGNMLTEKEMLERSCGKMLLLAKLLPKLRAEGRKVLIFSQFVIMLNVLEDYLKDHCGYPVERIDGSVSGRDRQQAIDRFSKGEEDSFVFLLSTRAGGQGITLTAADTCIIYDSDWNPQNDLQAMARCHRIGQSKEVTVYRLITKDTYEENLFQTANRKYGLDEAILGFSESVDPEADSKRIASLLRDGAHAITASEHQSEEFQKEDIDQILAGRTEKRSIGGKAGNSFSVATFKAVKEAGSETTGNTDKDGKEYWAELMPDAAAAFLEEAARLAAGPVVDGPRKRRVVNYNLNAKEPAYIAKDKDDADFEAKDHPEGSESEGGSEMDDVERSSKQEKKEKKPKAPKPRKWTRADMKLLEEKLLILRPGRWTELHQHMDMPYRPEEEVTLAAKAYLALMQGAQHMEEKRQRLSIEAKEAFDPLAEISSIHQHREDWDKGFDERMKALAGFAEQNGCPAEALTAMTNKEVLKRIMKQGPAHLLHLRDVEALHTLMGNDEVQPFKARLISLKGCDLPSWWTRYSDEALLQGAVKHGFTNYKRLAEDCLADPKLPFAARVVLAEQAAEPNASTVTASAGTAGGGDANPQGSTDGSKPPAGALERAGSSCAPLARHASVDKPSFEPKGSADGNKDSVGGNNDASAAAQSSLDVIESSEGVKPVADSHVAKDAQPVADSLVARDPNSVAEPAEAVEGGPKELVAKSSVTKPMELDLAGVAEAATLDKLAAKDLATPERLDLLKWREVVVEVAKRAKTIVKSALAPAYVPPPVHVRTDANKTKPPVAPKKHPSFAPLATTATIQPSSAAAVAKPPVTDSAANKPTASGCVLELGSHPQGSKRVLEGYAQPAESDDFVTGEHHATKKAKSTVEPPSEQAKKSTAIAANKLKNWLDTSQAKKPTTATDSSKAAAAGSSAAGGAAAAGGGATIGGTGASVPTKSSGMVVIMDDDEEAKPPAVTSDGGGSKTPGEKKFGDGVKALLKELPPTSGGKTPASGKDKDQGVVAMDDGEAKPPAVTPSAGGAAGGSGAKPIAGAGKTGGTDVTKPPGGALRQPLDLARSDKKSGGKGTGSHMKQAKLCFRALPGGKPLAKPTELAAKAVEEGGAGAKGGASMASEEDVIEICD